MLYIYGDSHSFFSFKNLTIPYETRHQFSITMFRVGRDNTIINFNPAEHDSESIICVAYGEVDCRCHIRRQIKLFRTEDSVIRELVTNYFRTLQNNIKNVKKVIVVGVIPPTRRYDYESLNGPITHQFPFVGTDSDRVRYTLKVNALIERFCNMHGYIYFNPYAYYTRDDGTLKYEFSDKNVHLGDNSYFLERFGELYTTLF